MPLFWGIDAPTVEVSALKGKTTCIILAVGAVFMLTLGQVTAQPGPGMMTVSEEDNGRLVGIGLHDRLVVRLGAQLGTGFSWAPAPPESGNLRLVDQRAEVRPQAAPGASETRSLHSSPSHWGQRSFDSYIGSPGPAEKTPRAASPSMSPSGNRPHRAKLQHGRTASPLRRALAHGSTIIVPTMLGW